MPFRGDGGDEAEGGGVPVREMLASVQGVPLAAHMGRSRSEPFEKAITPHRLLRWADAMGEAVA